MLSWQIFMGNEKDGMCWYWVLNKILVINLNEFAEWWKLWALCQSLQNSTHYLCNKLDSTGRSLRAHERDALFYEREGKTLKGNMRDDVKLEVNLGKKSEPDQHEQPEEERLWREQRHHASTQLSTSRILVVSSCGIRTNKKQQSR